MQGEEDPVLKRAEERRGDRGLDELAPDRRLLAGEDPEPQEREVDAKAATSATAGASVSREADDSWSPAVAPITKRKLKAEATA